ncbi:hypothetical protein MRX96_015437 [Rhipicephalus microplus]
MVTTCIRISIGRAAVFAPALRCINSEGAARWGKLWSTPCAVGFRHVVRLAEFEIGQHRRRKEETRRTGVLGCLVDVRLRSIDGAWVTKGSPGDESE